MTDPFLPQNVAGIYQELQRLRSENKELRLEVTTLRLRVQDQAAATSAPALSTSRKNSTRNMNTSPKARQEETDRAMAAVDERATQDGQGSDVATASSSAAAADHAASSAGPRPTRRSSQQQPPHQVSAAVQEEMRELRGRRAAAEQEAQKHQAELKLVTTHFEAFITEVTEREAGYRAVYGGIYNELAESKTMCAGLQRQVQELEARLAKEQEERRRQQEAMRVAGEARRSNSNSSNIISTTQEARPGQQAAHGSQRRRRQTANSAEGTPQASVHEMQRHTGTPAASEASTHETQPVVHTPSASPFAMPPPLTVTGDNPQTALSIAKGAGALRAEVYGKLERPRRRPTERPHDARRPRAASETEEVARAKQLPRQEMSHSGLFARFQHSQALRTGEAQREENIATSNNNNCNSIGLMTPSVPALATSAASIHFGRDPIADFLRLHERTTVAHHRSRLGLELMRHFGQQPSLLAEAVVRHFILSVPTPGGTGNVPSLSELWAQLEAILAISSDDLLPALTHAALAQLVHLVQGGAMSSGDDGDVDKRGNEHEEDEGEETRRPVAQTGEGTREGEAGTGVLQQPMAQGAREGGGWLVRRLAKVRLVGLVLRFAHLQSTAQQSSSSSNNNNTSNSSDTLLELFVALTLSALRRWSDLVRRGTTASSADNNPTAAMATLVQLWMTGVLALCGYQSSVQLFLRYYNVSEAARQAWVLPHALVCYTAQGIWRLCYAQCAPELQRRRAEWEVLRDARGTTTAETDKEAQREEEKKEDEGDAGTMGEDSTRDVWECFCDALGWSTRQMPLDKLGEAAAVLAPGTTPADAFLRRTCLQALRCLVLYKGFSYVHTVRECLARHTSARGGAHDAIFAELLSYAVLDLRLADSRDAQWTQTIAFLDDYLNNNNNTSTTYSTQEGMASEEASHGLHGLVLRAILQLCASPLNETGVRVLSRALRWVKLRSVHHKKDEMRAGGDGGKEEDAVPEVGRRLLQLIEQSS